MKRVSTSARVISPIISIPSTVLLIAYLVIAISGLSNKAFAQKTDEISLIEDAPNAVWSSGAGRLLFSNSRDDPRGFAIYRKSVYLEGYWGVEETILETHPEWVDDGLIRGEFHIPRIETGHHFMAKVGFMIPAGTPRTNGVTIKIIFNNETLFEDIKRYTGEIKDIKIDLSRFDGQSGTLIVEVGTNGDSTQDWFVWVNPHIGFP